MKLPIWLAMCLMCSVSAADAAQTPLVTGNGHGFAVLSLETGSLSSYLAHPYSFERPDENDALSEGHPTANLVKRIAWQPQTAGRQSFNYLNDSQIIASNSATGQQVYFMPFGLECNALIAINSSASSKPFAQSSPPKESGRFEQLKSLRLEAQNNYQQQQQPQPSQSQSARPPQSNALPKSQSLNIEWRFPTETIEVVKVENVVVKIVSFKGTQEKVALVSCDPMPKTKAPVKGKGRSLVNSTVVNSKLVRSTIPVITVSSGNSKKSSHSITMNLSGGNTWALLCIHPDEDQNDVVRKLIKWKGNLGAQALIDRELKQVEDWRVTPTVKFRSEEENHLWRQSEMILRMGQCKEANTDTRHGHGMIVAALPDGSWSVAWLRDMVYATFALVRMNHMQEARWAIEAMFNARPVGKMADQVGGPYQISVVRYFGNGEEEPFFTNEGATNIEFDNWGLALCAVAEYINHARSYSILDTHTHNGKIKEVIRQEVIEPIFRNLETYKDGLIVKEDTSIWEEREKDKKHFAFSTAAVLAGLSGYANSASDHIDQLNEKIEHLRVGFKQAFIKNNRVYGTLESGSKNDVDGANLASLLLLETFIPKIPNESHISANRAVLRGTASSMSALKMPSGGYRRVRSTLKDPSIYEYWYERQEFLFINFCLAEAYLRLNEPEKAHQLIDRMVAKSAQDHNLIPEMFVSQVNYRFKGPVGAPTGAIPMVGYGAGVYITYLLQRHTLGFDETQVPSNAKHPSSGNAKQRHSQQK